MILFSQAFSRKKIEKTLSKIASIDGRPTHYRNLRAKSMKIEFLRVQERICALSGKLPLYFASLEWEQRSLVYSFVSSSPYANATERETLLKGATSPFTSSSPRHEFLLRDGAINLEKCRVRLLVIRVIKEAFLDTP